MCKNDHRNLQKCEEIWRIWQKFVELCNQKSRKIQNFGKSCKSLQKFEYFEEIHRNVQKFVKKLQKFVKMCKKSFKKFKIRILVCRVVCLTGHYVRCPTIICPKNHLSCTSFVLHKRENIICPKLHLYYTSFVLQREKNIICPTFHLSYTSFVLHFICPAFHLYPENCQQRIRSGANILTDALVTFLLGV